MKKKFTHYVLLAGLAGGLAELVWIAGYSLVTGIDGWQVARMVAEVVVPAGATPMLGIAIHFLLSILLAGAFVRVHAPLRRRGAGATIAVGLMALAVVWAVNFFVILPIVHPAFVHLLPYPVTLLSKLLFGLAMAQALVMTPRVDVPLVADTVSRAQLAPPGR